MSIRPRGQALPVTGHSRIRSALRHGIHLIIGGVVAVPVIGVLAWALQLMFRPGNDWYGTALLLVIGAVVLFVPPVLMVTQGMQRIAAVELLGARLSASAGSSWPARIRAALWYYYSLISGLVFAAALAICLPTLLSVLLFLITGQQAGLADLLAQLAPGTPVPSVLPWVLGLCTGVPLLAVLLGVMLRPVAEALLGPGQRQLRLDAEERSRELARRNELARELHDSVGHALTVTTLQASAARRLLSRDPQAAAEAMSAVEHAGRTALAELDEVLGILRSPPAGGAPRGSAAPDPGRSLVSVGRLLEQSRAAGLILSATVPGSTTPVPPAVSRAAYRIIQEGLTNAMKYAPGLNCTLRLDVEGSRDSGALLIVMGNKLPDSGGRISTGGKGLTGLQERALVLGGTVVAGEKDGRFRLQARLPWGKETTP